MDMSPVDQLERTPTSPNDPRGQGGPFLDRHVRNVAMLRGLGASEAEHWSWLPVWPVLGPSMLGRWIKRPTMPP